MTENKDLKPVFVQKADMALSDLTSGGKLVADQRKKFILVNIKGQVVMSRIRVTTMSRESEEIPKMTTFGSQVWHPGTESQALTLAQRVKPGFDKVTLTSKEIVCQVDFPRYALADQVEGAGFKNTLIAYLGVHTKRDLENLIINGDTTSTNTLLALFDGMLAGASTNTYAAGGAAASTDVLDTTMLTMPEEYDAQPGMTYFTNKVAWAAYHKELGGRATPLGDTNQVNQGMIQYLGYPVVRVPLFPNNLGIGTNQTNIWFGDPKQFIFAFHENVEVQSEYNIRERTWTVVMTARIAQAYEHEPAVVKTTGVAGV